jgi:protein TonB
MKNPFIHSSNSKPIVFSIACGIFFMISACKDKVASTEIPTDSTTVTTVDTPKENTANGMTKDSVAKTDTPMVAEIEPPKVETVVKPDKPSNTKETGVKPDKPSNTKETGVKTPIKETTTVKNTGKKTNHEESNLPKDLVENPDQPSVPKDGYPGFYKFVRENLKYPEMAIKEGVEGSVRLQFVVSKDGTVSHIKVISGIGSGCDEEAVRIVKQSPKWQPAVYKGNPVTSKASIPISFKLK